MLDGYRNLAHLSPESSVAARLPLQFPGLGERADRLFKEKRIALADVRDGAAQLVELRITADQMVEERACLGRIERTTGGFRQACGGEGHCDHIPAGRSGSAGSGRGHRLRQPRQYRLAFRVDPMQVLDKRTTASMRPRKSRSPTAASCMRRDRSWPEMRPSQAPAPAIP